MDYSVWPTSITWGANSQTGSDDRYKVVFHSVPRLIDTAPPPERNNGFIGLAPRETQQLLWIQVQSNQSSPYDDSSWDPVRTYSFDYQTGTPPASYLLSDYSINSGDGSFSPDYDTTKLTLLSVQELGANNHALPPLTFTYGIDDRGSGQFPAGDWNRLTHVDNGKGGTITFAYENIGAAMGVGAGGTDSISPTTGASSRRQTDGQGHSYPWHYDYRPNGVETAALNSMGSADTLAPGIGPNANPNSATLYFTTFWDFAHRLDNLPKLVHAMQKEFRGHAYVIETDPNGNQIEHHFYQGDAGCNFNDSHPQGENIELNSCFQLIRELSS